MQTAFFAVVIPLATVGVVQFYNQIKAKDYEGAVTIIVAAGIGLIAGLTHYLGLSLTDALTYAFSAVGLHTVTTTKSTKALK